MDIKKYIMRLAKAARKASYELALVSTEEKNAALRGMARALRNQSAYILKENGRDLRRANAAGQSRALADRLMLNKERIDEMASCLRETARLPDPVGQVMRTIRRPNGLRIKKVRTPIGVIGIIYEARPNVTSDCIGLCLKSGNAVILKGGKEALYSNRAIYSVLRGAIKKTNITADAVQFISSTDRATVNALLALDNDVDVIIPRGGESLIRLITEQSRIPVIKHYKGVCHTYVSNKADRAMARAICLNAKLQRPGVCNAMETLLIHDACARSLLPLIARDLINAGVEIRGCPKTVLILKKDAKRASEKDWSEEYLDLILSVKIVSGTQEAIDHINTYGSKHSDAIVTADTKEARQFLEGVDSASVYVNASTRFTDGYQFGFGAEIGISTDKLHARGPMALEELTSYKYMVYGTGQVRK